MYKKQKNALTKYTPGEVQRHTAEGKHTSRKSNTPQYLIHKRKNRMRKKTIGKTQR